MSSGTEDTRVIGNRWTGVWLFAGSALGTLALLGFGSSLPMPVQLNDTEPALTIACGSAGRPPLEALGAFAVQARWFGFALLLATVGAAAFIVALVTLVSIAREPVEGTHSPATATWVLAGLGVLVALGHVYRLNWGDRPGTGFLSSLLNTVTAPEACKAIREMVWPMRTVGEGPALLLGAAMAATAAPTKNADTVASRIERLKLLLYCGSLLFVAGILVSESNFTWVTAQWGARDEHVDKAVADIIAAGTLQSGVGYSALLVIFFLPARSYLAWEARQVAVFSTDRAQAKKDLEDAGLTGSWRDDLKQILALLAPLLSAPLFEAIAG